MTWVKLDDSFSEHAKIMAISDGALRLHLSAFCFASRNLTDGAISFLASKSLRGLTTKRVNELVAANLWENMDGGWTIHDYLNYNPSREQVLKERANKKAAGMAGAKSRWDSKPIAGATASANAPVPSRPVPDPSPEKLSPKSPNGDSSESVPPRAKRQTVIGDDFREWAVAQFSRIPRTKVLEAIDNAVGHSSYRKWDDKRLYVLNWLKREFPEQEEREPKGTPDLLQREASKWCPKHPGVSGRCRVCEAEAKAAV